MGHVHQRGTLSAEKTVAVRMLVDTGATFSVIPEALARAVGVKRLRRSVAITPPRHPYGVCRTGS